MWWKVSTASLYVHMVEKSVLLVSKKDDPLNMFESSFVKVGSGLLTSFSGDP